MWDDIFNVQFWRSNSSRKFSSIAQSVEHAAVNRAVVGSSPTRGATKKSCKRFRLQDFFWSFCHIVIQDKRCTLCNPISGNRWSLEASYIELKCPIMEKSVQFCQMGLRRDFFITFNVLQAHLLKTLYYCIFDTKRLIRGHMKKGTRE